MKPRAGPGQYVRWMTEKRQAGIAWYRKIETKTSIIYATTLINNRGKTLLSFACWFGVSTQLFTVSNKHSAHPYRSLMSMIKHHNGAH